MESSNSIGNRLYELRDERGLTQRDLAELAGVSARMVSAIERGERGITVPNIYAFAEALGVQPSLLLDRRDRLRKTRRDAGVLAVRDVLLAGGDLPGLDVGDDGPPAPLDALKRDVAAGWDAYWGGRFGELAGLLPGLLRSARATEEAAGVPASGMLAQAYQLAADLMVHTGSDDLAFAGAARGLRAAERSGDPLQEAALSGTASWVLSHQGRLGYAEKVAAAAAAGIEPSGRVPMGHLTVYGSLLLSAAGAAAVAGDAGGVASYMAEAEITAFQFTEGDRHDLNTSFGLSQLRMQRAYQMTVLGEPKAALTAAAGVDQADLLHISRGALRLDVAQSNLKLGRAKKAAEVLMEAYELSPQWAEHQSLWRESARAAVRAARRRSDPLTDALARAAGLPATLRSPAYSGDLDM